MENGTLRAGPVMTGSRSTQLRLTSLLAALAIVLAMFVLVQQPADASPATASVAAAVALVGGGDAAQIDFRQIVCPILLQIRATYATSPFFSFVQPIIDQLLVSFGCIPGTTTTTVPPTTTTTVPPTTTTTTVVVTTTTTLFPLPTIPGINIGQITCPILLQLRASFANSPFFAPFLVIIDQLIVAFGCAPS